jgi:ABC-type nickel/cobalt efflux system permease component RcnA
LFGVNGLTVRSSLRVEVESRWMKAVSCLTIFGIGSWMCRLF